MESPRLHRREAGRFEPVRPQGPARPWCAGRVARFSSSRQRGAVKVADVSLVSALPVSAIVSRRVAGLESSAATWPLIRYRRLNPDNAPVGVELIPVCKLGNGSAAVGRRAPGNRAVAGVCIQRPRGRCTAGGAFGVTGNAARGIYRGNFAFSRASYDDHMVILYELSCIMLYASHSFGASYERRKTRFARADCSTRPISAEFHTAVRNSAGGKASGGFASNARSGVQSRGGLASPCQRRAKRPARCPDTRRAGKRARRSAERQRWRWKRNARGSFLGGCSGAFRPPVLRLHLRSAREEARGVERLGRVAQ